MVSTGTITLYPRNAAAPAVNRTAPCAIVPVTMTVRACWACRMFPSSVPVNFSAPVVTEGSPGFGSRDGGESLIDPFPFQPAGIAPDGTEQPKPYRLLRYRLGLTPA